MRGFGFSASSGVSEASMGEHRGCLYVLGFVVGCLGVLMGLMKMFVGDGD